MAGSFQEPIEMSDKVRNPIISARQLESVAENVCVAVRVRPLNVKELENGSTDVTLVDQQENTIEIRNWTRNESKRFRFDAVFPPSTEQAEMYNQIARPIVANVIEGYNGTIFAYGQTGTGKTFTMEGDRKVPELKGIIPNSFAQIFSHISQETGNSKFLVRVTYLEIYNEEVRDLLGKDTSTKLDIKEGEVGVYVKGLSSFVVKSEKDMERILGVGKKNRAVGTTNMNVESSRSHAIFTVTVECSTENGERQSLRMGKLNLVDLAGSERAGKSGVTGIRLKEGAKINLSLSCLGKVISDLVDAKSHIPYRSSKLTRLLQDSLGGNSKTVMIANIGPAEENYEETLSTLRYADRAKRIRNHAHINEDPKDAILRQFENEIHALKKQLEEEDAKLQRVMGHEGDAEEEQEMALGFEDEETLTGIRGELETQQRLSSTVEAASAQKHSTLVRLKENVLTWKEQQERKAALQEKLESIQKKIMVGGESLLDKSQEQEAYLQRCLKELKERREEQSKLQVSLTSKMAEKVVSEERVKELREERKRLHDEMAKWYKILKTEAMADELVQEEERAEKEALEKEVRRLNYQIAKDRSIIDNFIPKEALNLIVKNMDYSSQNSAWNVRQKEFAGNNLKLAHPHCQGSRNYSKKKDLSFVYTSIDRIEADASQAAGDDERNVDYASIPPVRTRDFISPEETLKLMEEHDLLDPPSFHFVNFTPSDQELFSKRNPRGEDRT